MADTENPVQDMQAKEPLVSAVILAYNRCGEALITLEKLKKIRDGLPFGMEIIVVDNGSVDDISVKVPQLHPDITFIHKEKNNGIAGWNEGFKAVKTKYILVLDDDSCVHDGLPEALHYFETQPDAGILALNIVDEHLQGDPHLDKDEAWKHLQHIAGFIGCGALIKTEVYKNIGGFAEWVFVYTHEFEYAIRCLNAGYDIIFFEKSNVVHRASTINRSNKRQRIFATRNELGIVYKYFATNRRKYLLRVFLNNLKLAKREGFMAGYYIMQGGMEFLKLKKTLAYTPVSQETQDFYAANFWSTKPVFENIKKRFKK